MNKPPFPTFEAAMPYAAPSSKPLLASDPPHFFDRELRKRIRLLSVLLARVLKTQADPETFQTLQELRTGFAKLREQGAELARRVKAAN